MLRRMLLAALALVVFALPGRAQERYTSPKGRFTITLPQKPREVSDNIDTKLGRVQSFTAVCEQPNNTGFFVAYADYPSTVTATPVQEILSSVRDRSVGTEGKLIDDKEIVHGQNKVPGRDYLFVRNDRYWRMQVFQEGVRLYQVAGIYMTKAAAKAADADSFFASLLIHHTHTSDAGKYSVVFPKKPNLLAKEAPIEGDKVKIYFAALELDSGYGLLASYSDMPMRAADKQKPMDLLAKIRDGAKGPDGKVVKDSEIAFGEAKIPGREYWIEKGPIVFRCRTYVLGSRVYQLMVIGTSQDRVNDEASTNFLDSFRIAK
jgi:hypothetical protein